MREGAIAGPIGRLYCSAATCDSYVRNAHTQRRQNDGQVIANKREMLYTIALIVMLVLLFSPLISWVAENEVHNLLVVAIFGLLIRGVQAKSKALY